MAVDFALTRIAHWHKMGGINDDLFWEFIGDFCDDYGTEFIASRMAALGLW